MYISKNYFNQLIKHFNFLADLQQLIFDQNVQYELDVESNLI